MNERLRKLRKMLKLTQQEFANRIGVKRNSYANYEIGRNIPIDAIILSICREFNVSEEWLRTGAGGDDNMFVKLSKDEELTMCTQMLLNSTDDIIADKIKEVIVIYENLDNDFKLALNNLAKVIIDKMKNT